MALHEFLQIAIILAISLAVWFFIVTLVALIVTNAKLKKCVSKMDAFNSKLNDVQLINSTFLRRIERRCDAIDQRTKAHLNTKKTAKKKYNSTNTKQPSHNNNKGQCRSTDRSLF
jgi:hypothetical protein